MKNDLENITIDYTFGVDLIYGNKPLILLDIAKYIKQYIKHFEIANIGVAIVYQNAKLGISEPSEPGTMRNLYNLFTYYFMEAEDEIK